MVEIENYYKCLISEIETKKNWKFALEQAYKIEDIINKCLINQEPITTNEKLIIQESLLTLNNNHYAKKIFGRVTQAINELEIIHPYYEIRYEKIDKGNRDKHEYRLLKNNEEVCFLSTNGKIPNYKKQVMDYYEKNKKIIFYDYNDTK
jgi:hypothetical protein